MSTLAKGGLALIKKSHRESDVGRCVELLRYFSSNDKWAVRMPVGDGGYPRGLYIATANLMPLTGNDLYFALQELSDE